MTYWLSIPEITGHLFLSLATTPRKIAFVGAFEKVLFTSDIGKSVWVPAVAIVLYSISGEDFLPLKMSILSEASLHNLSSNFYCFSEFLVHMEVRS